MDALPSNCLYKTMGWVGLSRQATVADPFNPFIRDTAMNKTDMTLRELSFLLGMILCYSW